MRRLGFATLAVSVATFSSVGAVSRQAGADADRWPALTRQLDQAVLDENVTGLKAVRVQLLQLQLASTTGDRRALVQYAVAYADWRMAFNPAASDREQSDYLDEAETQLQASMKSRPRFAEALGLLGSVYGGKIARSPMSGMVFGPRASEAIEDALAIEPDNPRLLLSKGVSKFNTPSAFGGDMKEAEALLRRALDRFAGESADKPWPTWGRFDAHAWLGQTIAKRGDKTGARAEYQRALEIAPRSGWITHVLIPALDK